MGNYASPSRNKNIHKSLSFSKLSENEITSDLEYCYLPNLEDKDIKVFNNNCCILPKKKTPFFPSSVFDDNCVELPYNEEINTSDLIMHSEVRTPGISTSSSVKGIHGLSCHKSVETNKNLYEKEIYLDSIRNQLLLIPDLSKVKNDYRRYQLLPLRKK